MKLKKTVKKLFEDFWEGDLQPATLLGRATIKTARLGAAVLRDAGEGRFGQRASSLAYTSLVTFVPLLALAFSVLKGFGVHDALQVPLRAYLSPLGEEMAAEIAVKVTGFVENVNVGVLGAVGSAFLLFGVLAMMQKMELAFNDIWRVPRARSFVKRVRDYLVVILFAPLSLFLAVAMTTSLNHIDLAWAWLRLDLVDSALENVFSIAPWVLFVLAFAALYAFMPNTRVRAVPALGAGLVTAVLWKLLGKLFGLFVAGSATYAAIYSVFAVLVLFMLWVYAGWMVVLLGAAVCYYMQNPSNQPLSRRANRLSLRVKEKIALQLCAEIGHEFYKENRGLTVPQLAQRLRAPGVAVMEVAEDLEHQGILAATDTGALTFIPGRPFDTATVEDLMTAIRTADETGVLMAKKIHGSPSVNAAVKLTEKALHRELGKYTLKQLALGSIHS